MTKNPNSDAPNSDPNIPSNHDSSHEDNHSEELTQEISQNKNYRLPNSNNNWQVGEEKIDLEQEIYLIEKKLGEGGFGITYLATKKATNKKKVVIKVLKYELRNKPNFQEIEMSFLNEAVLLNSCRSPFIVSLDKEVTIIDSTRAIIMEYIEGRSLADKVKEKGGKLPIKLALKYIRQIGEGLTIIHGKKLLHRDIKPENILIRQATDEAVLIDFGLAFKFIPNQPQYNRQWLTPGFAPIEQYQEKVEWGEYTDVYALAATLYYTLTGQPSISAEKRNSGSNLPEPRTLNSKISERINQAILEGLHVEPRIRSQTVEAWLKLLKNPFLDKFKLIPVTSIIILVLLIIIISFLWLRKSLCNQVYFPLLVNLPICQTSDLILEEYISDTYEFKLKYPQFLTIDEIPKDALRPWQLKFYLSQQQEPVMVVFVEDLNHLYSLEDYWQNLVKLKLKNEIQAFDIDSTTPTKIDLKADSERKEHSAYQFRYKHNRADESIEVMEVITVYNYRAYTIRFQGNESDYQEYESMAEDLINSFEFTISDNL